MKYETRNLQELPKFRDGLSYLYLEHGRSSSRIRPWLTTARKGWSRFPLPRWAC